MIVLFTDFGVQDPYVGQMKAVLAQQAPGVAVIDLLHHVPDYDIRAGAYLLAAYMPVFPADSVFVCVVDPGVGTDRLPCVARIGQRWFVGPDNGLFSVLQQRHNQTEWWTIQAPQQAISATFHGRDVFAPVAARLACGDYSGLQVTPAPAISGNFPQELAEIIYIDHYGNLVSGYRFASLPADVQIEVSGIVVGPAHTFSDVAPGEPFYYCNSNGLLEIAVNQGNASQRFGASVGDPLQVRAVG